MKKNITKSIDGFKNAFIFAVLSNKSGNATAIPLQKFLKITRRRVLETHPSLCLVRSDCLAAVGIFNFPNLITMLSNQTTPILQSIDNLLRTDTVKELVNHLNQTFTGFIASNEQMDYNGDVLTLAADRHAQIVGFMLELDNFKSELNRESGKGGCNERIN